jgi:two-component system cell cycle sensor histidine kinase/response regulator CckA
MGGRGDESDLAWRLGERVKELTLLHGVARLLQTGRAPDEALLAEVVALVPPAWQFPELCEARIRWLQVEARSPGWSESPWILRAALGPTPDDGLLEIAYRQAPSRSPEAPGAPGVPEEPFLREERELIASLAEMLGASFARSRAEVMLREREARLYFLYTLSERTRTATEVDEILAIVVEMLGRELRASRCAVVHVEDHGRRCWIPHDYTDGCPSFVGPYEMTEVGADLLRDAGRPIVARDIAAEFPGPIADKQLALGVHAMIIASHTKEGAVRSLMAVQQTTPRDWTEHEVMLVAETVSRTWAHIEQRSTEAKLRRVEGHLRQAQKMEAIGQLAAGVAHDFSNLLSVILSYSTFIIEELPPGDAVRGDVAEIEIAAKRGVELTRQLLTFSRKQPLQPKACNLTAIAGGVEKMLRRLIGDRIRLAMHCASDAGQTLVDPGQVEQVLMNFVVNARDAMPEGGEITICVENVTLAAMRVDGQEVTPGGYVMLAVRDTGQGMDAATRARIFEPFFTTKEKGKGTGLGLATVYGIVKQSGGHIQVVSEPGAGTTFSVYFPRIDQVEGAETTPVVVPSTEPPIELHPKPATYAGDGEHVLLVDDEEALVMLTERVLKRLGYRVTGFTSGADALAALRAEPEGFQAVVTDVSMPGMGGFQLTRQIWEIRPDMPVVVTSGYFTDEDMRTASAIGLRSLVVKPDTIEELGRVLHEALRHDVHRRAG